ncbi:MAG: AmmeMemoRadiSam system protein B [Thiohalocapsa sp. PB-PSB1]|jgi:AmmeMemoRadiSam system protein B/AmmeMemoRadiSam system protein A|nr:MAG: AmmeMemoRadiSam system protein B [Thiohalocapsa sp. PB-PSB1]
MTTPFRRIARPLLALLPCLLGTWAASASNAAPEVPNTPGPVRESALAGAWYPADPAELRALVDRFLAPAEVPEPQGRLRALIVPHAGYAYSGPTAGQAFSMLRDRTYRRVLILAPAHYSGFQGVSVADVNAFRTPLGDIPLDRDALKVLQASALFRSQPAAHVREHSIEIELPLLQQALTPGWKLIPVLIGALQGDQYQMAADLLRPMADETTLVVVSSDFTHYGPRFNYLPFALDADTPARIRELDEGAIAHIRDKDPEGFLRYQQRTGITICGFRPIEILLRMLGPEARIEPIAHTTSGELTGDYSNSVSYVALAVTDPKPLSAASPVPLSAASPVPSSAASPDPLSGELTAPAADPSPVEPLQSELDQADLKRLHHLATLAVEDAVFGPSDLRQHMQQQAVEALPDRLKMPAGAFVTLKRNGQLRGCIGYIEPRQPLYLAILANGDNAARRDLRFRPVQPAELAELEIEVSVLTPPRPIQSWQDFKVGEQGIILSKAGRHAVFLPEVATEQGWTRQETLSHLAVKAGLSADAWRDGASFEVFDSIHYHAPYVAVAPESTARGAR